MHNDNPDRHTGTTTWAPRPFKTKGLIMGHFYTVLYTDKVYKGIVHKELDFNYVYMVDLNELYSHVYLTAKEVSNPSLVLKVMNEMIRYDD